MEESQFSSCFDLRRLCNMSVEVYVFMKALTMKKFSYTLRRVRVLQHWTTSISNIFMKVPLCTSVANLRRVRVLQHWTTPSSNIFMKVPLCTSVASVFIELQNLFSSENDRTRLIFTRPRVVLTRNCNFKMAVDLLESNFTQFWMRNPNLLSPFHKSQQIIFSKWRRYR